MAEFDWGLADIAKSKNDPCLLAVMVGPLLAGAEAQARLQATDLLAPLGEGFFLLLLFRSRFHRFPRSRLLVGLFDFEFQFPCGVCRNRTIEPSFHNWNVLIL